MRHLITLAAIFVAFCTQPLYSQQTPNELAVFRYKDGREITYDLNLSSLLSLNRIELKNRSIPDTTGLESIRIDSSYFFVINQPGNEQRPQVIVKRIIQGKIELFSTPDPSAQNQFFTRKDGTFRELRTYRRYVNASEFVLVKEYISVLKYLFLDCPKVIPPEIDKLSLNQKSLSPLINRYNLYFGTAPEMAVAGEKEKRFMPSVEFSFLLGYSNRNADVHHIHTPYEMSSTMNNRGASFGISILLKPSRSSRLDFALDLMYGKIHESSRINRQIDDNSSAISEITYDFIHARHNAIVRYNISPGEALKVRVGIGGSMHWRDSNSSRATVRWIYNSDEYSSHTVAIGNVGSSGYMPMATISVEYKSFDLRYNYGTNTLHFRNWENKSAEQRLILGINLSSMLKKK